MVSPMRDAEVLVERFVRRFDAQVGVENQHGRHGFHNRLGINAGLPEFQLGAFRSDQILAGESFRLWLPAPRDLYGLHPIVLRVPWALVLGDAFNWTRVVLGCPLNRMRMASLESIRCHFSGCFGFIAQKYTAWRGSENDGVHRGVFPRCQFPTRSSPVPSVRAFEK